MQNWDVNYLDLHHEDNIQWTKNCQAQSKSIQFTKYNKNMGKLLHFLNGTKQLVFYDFAVMRQQGKEQMNLPISNKTNEIQCVSVKKTSILEDDEGNNLPFLKETLCFTKCH